MPNVTTREQWQESIDAVANLLYQSGRVEKEFVRLLAFEVVQEVLYHHMPKLFKPEEANEEQTAH